MQNIQRIATNKTSAKPSSIAEPLEQRIAPAGVFHWNATGGGAWNASANWTLVSGDAGQGFPDGVNDEAIFANAITANSTITIPDNIEITLSKLRFDDNNSYSITSVGSGHLLMSSSSGQASIISTNANGTASHFVQAPIHLAADTTFSNSTNSPLVIQTSIVEDSGYRGVTKNGTGVVTFAGAVANNYSGETIVLDGLLQLAKDDGIAAVGSGQLTIGRIDGVGNPRVVLDSSHQIPNNQNVIVIGSGILDLANFAESFENLTLIDDATVATGTGTLTLLNVVAGCYEAGVSPTISGFLNLAGSATINVINTSVESLLTIGAVLKGSSGFTKIGTGTLELTSASSQQYTGQTKVSNGTLLLNTTTSDAGISNDIRIEKDGVLRVKNSFEIPDSATVTIAGGRLEVPVNEDFRNLALGGGTVSIANGATLSIRSGGSVSVPGSVSSGGSSIEGPGTFRLLEDMVTFSIGETLDDVDLKITAPMTGLLSTAGILKLGTGQLALVADGGFLGGIHVAEGGLNLGGTQSSLVTLAAGRLTGVGYSQGTFDGLNASGGRIEPTNNFKSTGNVAMGAGSVFAPSCDFYPLDLEVVGTVDVSGATLEFAALTLQDDNYTSSLVIIDNDGADPVVGTFAGLAEGATVETPRGNFTISYAGGSGNDVTLTPVYVTPTILAGGKAASFIDVDGDLVTVRVSQGTLTADNFKLLAAGEGALIQKLTLDNASYEGTSLKLTATPKNGLGDRQVNVEHLVAEVDFTTISIPGDLGYFEIGSAGTPTPAFKSMKINSIGYSAPIASPGTTYVSTIAGAFGSLKVKGDIIGANIQAVLNGNSAGSIAVGGSLLPGTGNGTVYLSVNGNIGKVSIAGDFVGGELGARMTLQGNAGKVSVGGSIIGSDYDSSGSVFVAGDVGSMSVGRDIIGSSGVSSGSVNIVGKTGSVKIGGGVSGGSGTDSGTIKFDSDVKSVSIGDDLRGGSAINSGAILGLGSMGTVKIGGSIMGGASGSGLFADRFGSVTVARDLIGTALGRAVVCASGIPTPADASSALAIASITVGRDVTDADILAGYEGNILLPSVADVQIGKIAVKGDWSSSRALAGVQSVDGSFANGNDQAILGGSAEIASRIASIVVGGSIRGTVQLGDSYGFVAEQIGALSVAGKKVTLDPAAKDAISFGAFGDTAVREI